MARKLTVKLRGEDRSLCTPAVLLPTCSGVVPFLTDELLAELCAKDVAEGSVVGAYVPYSELLESTKIMKKLGTCFRDFANVPDNLCMVVGCRSKSEATNANITKKNSAEAMSFKTHHGRVKVTPKEYCSDAADMVKPDILLQFAEETSSKNQNRLRKTSERAISWLKTCAAHDLGDANLVAALVGGVNERLREDHVNASVEIARQSAAGYAICELGIRENETASERLEIVQKSIAQLESIGEGDKIRLVSAGCLNLSELLELAAKGVDVLSTSYPLELTQSGKALVLPAPRQGNESKRRRVGDGDTVMDMNDKSYAHDHAPMVKGCECFACKTHTRAYIYHLIDAKEMLGQTLLFIHNAHCMLSAFRHMRSGIAQPRI